MTNNIDTYTHLKHASNIENVDFAIYDWLDKKLNLSCNSNDGFKKVPVMWVTPERAFQVKHNKEFRDYDGTLNLPMITAERISIVKDVKNNATYYTNLPPNNNRHIVARRINQKKTSEFANASREREGSVIGFVKRRKNEKVVYQYDSMMLPVYATFTYSITLVTQFQQQMNELVQPFLSITGSTRYFLVERDGYKYECFIEPNFDIKNNISSMDEEERRYITNITIKVLANLIGQDENETESIIKTYENAVELKFPRENVILSKTLKVPKELQIAPPSNATQIYSNVLMKKVFVVGNTVDSVYRIDHNFNSRDILVVVRTNGGEDGTDFGRVEVAIDYTDPNSINLDFGDIIPNEYYYVTVLG